MGGGRVCVRVCMYECVWGKHGSAGQSGPFPLQAFEAVLRETSQNTVCHNT